MFDSSMGRMAREFSNLARSAADYAGSPAVGQRSSDAPQTDDARRLSTARLAGTRRGFCTRRVNMPESVLLLSDDVEPRPGDLLLARVEALGQHARLELPDGRRSHLYVGDEIIVAYGHRYAPDQFESEVPDDLGECHLVAAGGIASRLLSKHASVKAPTRLKPLGLLAGADAKPLNLADCRIDSRSIPKQLPPVLAVVGTAMNAGKTTTAARLIKGLQLAGKRVGAAKVTGTGAGGDIWQMKDAGAVEVVDFTDAGHASTYMLAPQAIEKVFLRLLSHLGNLHLDAIVIEVADGLLQTETAELLAAPAFSFYCDRIVFAANDALGAAAGVQWLQTKGLAVSAVSGALTASPLAVREASGAIGLPVLTKKDLSDPATACALIEGRA